VTAIRGNMNVRKRRACKFCKVADETCLLASLYSEKGRIPLKRQEPDPTTHLFCTGWSTEAMFNFVRRGRFARGCMDEFRK
jgi:hypothetical protein